MIIVDNGLDITFGKNGVYRITINPSYPHIDPYHYGTVDNSDAIFPFMRAFYNRMKNSSNRSKELMLLVDYHKRAMLNPNGYQCKVLEYFETNFKTDFNTWFPTTNVTPETETEPSTEEQTSEESPAVKSAKELCIEGLQKLMDFFSEFKFEPSFRFVNTFTRIAKNESIASATEYIRNYFALLDSPYLNEITDKIKSKEFSRLATQIRDNAEPTITVNQRLKVYYGSAGTGKTTRAQEESENRCIVCNNSMLPADLMEDFCFEDGHPSFNPSLLWHCMENGEKLVLDEINLLPFDSLRFLQGIVDGKKEFYYKNRLVKIADGFQIIGTMNLTLNGMVYGLPEPLVDRCSEMKEFKLTAEQLYNAVA